MTASHGLVEVEIGGIDGGHTVGGVHEVDDPGIRPVAGRQLPTGLAADWPVSSAERLAILASSLAVSRMRTGASGATTVVMSRPSTTMPGLSRRAR